MEGNATTAPSASPGNLLETRITWSHPRSPNSPAPRMGLSTDLYISRFLMCSRWRITGLRVFRAVSSGLGGMLPSNGSLALTSFQGGRTPKERGILDCTVKT